MARIGASGTGGATSGGIPAGANGEIQFNDGGAFGANGGLTYDGANLNVSNGVVSAVDFIYSRVITIDITVPNHCSMINNNMHLTGSVTLTLLGDADLILL